MLGMVVYVDASFAVHPYMRSHSGIVVTLFPVMVAAVPAISYYCSYMWHARVSHYVLCIRIGGLGQFWVCYLLP
jgi:hypothetical protein